ncbi:MAG: hypothetical protein IJO43_02400 [Bacilli bacterium]|nr:hypothetical protein [Bacilli bacterium]
MEFLKNKGFSDEQINLLLSVYDKEIIETFLLNKDNVVEVIDYLKEYGIKDIPKLMIERIDIFYLPYKVIDELFSHYEKDSVIATLDYDASIFDEMI